MDQVKATLQGVNASLSRRNLSPTTQEILRLLASKAEDAIRKDAAGIDHQALLSEMQKINTLNAYVTKRSVDLARLSNLDTVAKLGDYAMMYCQRLKKEADPESAFRKMMWISIHDVLEAENAREAQWNSQGRQGRRPLRPMHDEIDKALANIEEKDFLHGYWVIAFYAKRNSELHSDILDQRLQGNYERVLEIVQQDIDYITNLLTTDRSQDNVHYLNMCLAFRRTWFEETGTADGPIWQPNYKAQKHLKELAQQEKNMTLAHSPPETEFDKLQRTIAALSSELNDIKTLVSQSVNLAGSAASLGLATLEMQAASTSEEMAPNAAQKRILSEHEVFTPETKRKKQIHRSS